MKQYDDALILYFEDRGYEKDTAAALVRLLMRKEWSSDSNIFAWITLEELEDIFSKVYLRITPEDLDVVIGNLRSIGIAASEGTLPVCLDCGRFAFEPGVHEPRGLLFPGSPCPYDTNHRVVASFSSKQVEKKRRVIPDGQILHWIKWMIWPVNILSYGFDVTMGRVRVPITHDAVVTYLIKDRKKIKESIDPIVEEACRIQDISYPIFLLYVLHSGMFPTVRHWLDAIDTLVDPRKYGIFEYNIESFVISADDFQYQEHEGTTSGSEPVAETKPTGKKMSIQEKLDAEKNKPLTGVEKKALLERMEALTGGGFMVILLYSGHESSMLGSPSVLQEFNLVFTNPFGNYWDRRTKKGEEGLQRALRFFGESAEPHHWVALRNAFEIKDLREQSEAQSRSYSQWGDH
ncbi:MAG: hypothetical protein UU35_C0017G0003 [Candidatus Uhrbacteria bacterium GW2011_GWC2_41_11]|uniref:Uncharacterized protein n=1 Tax=Candidatus Uhrbacteria bacterium GW2011_GWC2_41_11 TaxID=1618985 RepID=A0A0G0XES3_9BACT|nr:MAG: hypothetical protein UU35_C0017G0003 [Candidatus Uhrbacteria bacterium GW2011_GWC2_41_11]